MHDQIASCLQGRKIFVLNLAIFAESAGLPSCSIETTFRVDPITNVPFLRDDPQVRPSQHSWNLLWHVPGSPSALPYRSFMALFKVCLECVPSQKCRQHSTPAHRACL